MQEQKHARGANNPIPGVPQLTARFVDRPRLDATLDELLAGTCGVVTIWSAAGSGKTTLLAHWARQLYNADLDVIWISGESLGQVPDILQVVIEADIERLERGQTLRSIVIVDDFHLLPAGTAKATVTALIDALPSLAGLIIAGRYQPLGTLTALQATENVAELRTSDLAFTRAELNALTESHGLALDTAVVDVLLRRTDGWAIALALAAPWLKGKADVGAAVASFDGDHRAVGDFLVSEVLESLSVDERFVLSKSAIRSDIPLELAVYLAGMPNAGELLHGIAQRNLLMIEDSGGYHYHPVLLSFLQADARRKDADAFAQAHVRAFRWFAEREDGMNALEEAISSAQVANVQIAIEQFGLDLILAGETDLVSRAMEALSGQSTPIAVLAMGLLLEAPFFADVAKAKHLFDDALRHDEAGTPTVELWLAVVCALHCLTGQTEAQFEARLARLRMADILTLRRDSLGLDLLAEMAEAWSVGRLGSHADALRMLREVGIAADRAGYSWLSLMAASFASPLATLSGRWDMAAAIEDQVVAQLLSAPHSHIGRVRSTATIMSVAQAYRRCEPVSGEALDALIAAGEHDISHGARVPAVLARSYAALDSDPNPRPVLETVNRLMRDHGPQYPSMFAVAAVSMVSLHLRLDGRAEAQQRAEDFYALLGRDCVEAQTVRFALTLPARSGDAAEESLLSALEDMTPAWHSGAPVNAWLLLAQAAENGGRHSEADTRLGNALRLAHRFDAVHPFAARGGEGTKLLESRVGRFGHLDVFAGHVIESVRALVPIQPEGTTAHETLTRREHEILKELPVHQSVAEIARKMTLSVNTVKTHLRSIYQKLNVSDRSEAVSVAQFHGLL